GDGHSENREALGSRDRHSAARGEGARLKERCQPCLVAELLSVSYHDLGPRWPSLFSQLRSATIAEQCAQPAIRAMLDACVHMRQKIAQCPFPDPRHFFIPGVDDERRRRDAVARFLVKPLQWPWARQRHVYRHHTD